MSPENMNTTSKRRQTTYSILFITLFLGYFFLRPSSWVGNTQIHTLLESIATLLALFVSLMALVRFYTKKQRIFLFIGTGFLGTTFLDGYHALVTSTFFNTMVPSPPPSLIPWSWIASRLFLAILMWLSWVAWYREERLGQAVQISERMVYSLAGLLTLVSFIFFAFVPLGRIYFPEVIFHRPEEFIPAFFFLWAFVGYYRKGYWSQSRFEHWLVMSLIVGFMSQAMFMSFSGQMFDVMFDIAHLLKMVSYICVLTGLMISMARLFKQAEKSKEELVQFTEILELRVTERTANLRQANQHLIQVLTEYKQTATKLRQAHQELSNKASALERANVELGQYTYFVSHDLQAPLRAIHHYADFLNEDLAQSLDGDQKLYLNNLIHAVHEAEDLVQDLLELSRIGRRKLPSEIIDSGVFLKTLITQLDLPADVEIEMQSDWPLLEVEPYLFQQIFQNLILNGLKFNHSSPKRIELGWQVVDEDYYELYVRDNGIGIKAHHHHQIFKVFQRLHLKQAYEGTGVGLALVKKASNTLKGSVRVESKFGQSSTFYVTLPKIDQEDFQ